MAANATLVGMDGFGMLAMPASEERLVMETVLDAAVDARQGEQKNLARRIASEVGGLF